MTDGYTADEVARHNNANDLWLVIHGVVYDVTSFRREHPGGEEVLQQLAGQDATECFDSIGHSYEAINLRESFKIGELVDGVRSGKSETTSAEVKESMEEDDWQYQELEEEKSSWLPMFICIIAVIYAMIAYYWFRKL